MIHDHAPHKDLITQLLINEIAHLRSHELIELGKALSEALINDKSSYRGICKERHILFRSEEYGKTSLWQELIERIQWYLKESHSKNKKGAKPILSKQVAGFDSVFEYNLA